MPNILTIRGLKQAEITHDAQLIKAVPIDDTQKADQKVLSYNQAGDKIVYIQRCPEIEIQAIRHFDLTIPSADLSAQVTFSEVDPTKTFLIWGGCTGIGVNNLHGLIRIDLVDSTHVRAIRNTGGADVYVNFCLIECITGINSIQRGTIVLTTELTRDATINAVNTAKAFVSHLGASSNHGDWSGGHINIHLYDSVTVRAYHKYSSDISTISYEVVEFT